MSISIKELLDAGAHFGHQTHRWNPKMRPYIYGARNGIYIINLQKTAEKWREAREAVIEVVRRGGKLLFVGTKPQAHDVVAEEAEKSGQFYVNGRWLGGMLTNFKTMRKRLDRLEVLDQMAASGDYAAITKKERVRLDKERAKLDKSLHGIKSMKRVPAMVVIVDPNKEHIARREAKKLHIPVLSITDTNCDPDGIDYLIPANDDALKSIRLFLGAIADACMEGEKEFEKRIQDETRRQMEEAKAKAAQPQEAAPVEPSENAVPVVKVQDTTPVQPKEDAAPAVQVKDATPEQPKEDATPKAS